MPRRSLIRLAVVGAVVVSLVFAAIIGALIRSYQLGRFDGVSLLGVLAALVIIYGGYRLAVKQATR
ncbi:hypothetical protein ACEYYH_10710 [Microbacterium trichothecenolyticum]|uniref:hypothetical protein n=1 Tax=Microbacterium trichothecenolyticum TaxID=69370 RepID=UPI0035BE6452